MGLCRASLVVRFQSLLWAKPKRWFQSDCAEYRGAKARKKPREMTVVRNLQALAEGRGDLFGDELHVVGDVLLTACATDQHGARACVDVFLEPLAAIVGITVERVATRDLREVLRVGAAEGLGSLVARHVAIGIDRREDEKAGAEVAHVAAGFLAELVNLLDALMQHLWRVHVGDPAVGVSGSPAHRRLLAAGDPDGRMRLLYGVRRDGDARELGEAAVEGDVLFGPELLDHFEGFIAARGALLDRHAA